MGFRRSLSSCLSRLLWGGLLVGGFVSAEEYGVLSYEVIAGDVRITDCVSTTVGGVVVPAEIDGLPVTTIGRSAFSSCREITAIELPVSVALLEGSAFAHCAKLSRIEIPDGVSSIPESCFSYCKGLGEVVLPGSMKSIEAHAFYDCESLQSVVIPAGVVGIGESAFSRCLSLSNVSLSEGLMSLGLKAFSGCSSLPNVLFPESLLVIGDDAFTGCSSVTELRIPAGLWLIGIGAFSHCANLETIEVDPLNDNFRIDDGVLIGLDSLEVIQCPTKRSGGYVVLGGMKKIGAKAFSGCVGLTSISLPLGIEEIGEFAFSRCSGLSSLSLPGSLVSIGRSSFNGCVGLSSLTIQEGVTRIESDAFHRCTSLLDLDLPSSLEWIGDYAFFSCSGLVSVTIPAGVQWIGQAGFRYCSDLREMYFLGDAPGTGGKTFIDAADDFRYFRFSGTTGYTGYDWENPQTVIDRQDYPAAEWLFGHGLSYDLDLEEEVTSDGLSLMLAYALDLSPWDQPHRRLPRADLSESTLSMTFIGGQVGVGYRVETSRDGLSWTSDGVTLTAPFGDRRWRAYVPRAGTRQFLRLVVEFAD